MSKSPTLKELNIILKMNNGRGDVWINGDHHDLIYTNDSIVCPECKSESNENPCVTIMEEDYEEDVKGRKTYYLTCPRCGYYEEQDNSIEVDDDSEDPDNRNYYV